MPKVKASGKSWPVRTKIGDQNYLIGSSMEFDVPSEHLFQLLKERKLSEVKSLATRQ